MDRQGIDRIGLAYFGHVDPALYGIDAYLPRPDQPGLVAVSANFLHGYGYMTYAGGRMVPVPAGAYTWIARYPARGGPRRRPVHLSHRARSASDPGAIIPSALSSADP